MKTQLSIAMCAALTLATGSKVLADPWKNESGHYRWRGDDRDYYRVRAERDEYKEEFYQNGCKVKREWRRDGRYKEEVECERRR